MLTTKFVQLERKKRKDGTIPIYIRITEDRKSRYKSTGISVLPKYWNPKGELRKSHPQYTLLSAQLLKISKELDKTKYELIDVDKFNIYTLSQELSDENTQSILFKAEQWLEQLQADKRYWEQRHFKVIIGNLESFIKSGKTEQLSEIDSEWIEEFQKYLVSHKEIDSDTGEEKIIVNNPQTVNKKLQRLRSMFKWLIKHKEIKIDPFQTIQRVEERKGDSKVKLSFEQITAIENLELEDGSKLWHARNYFMYSFYNAGIRFGDLCTLKWNNLIDGRLEYTMHKTGGKKSIRQLEPMQKILDLYRSDNDKPNDYIFPILHEDYSDPMKLRKAISSHNVLVNRMLKELTKLAGIQANVSFHVSRHSFAHYALKKGMDLYSISKALGHSDLKVTEEYIKSFDEELLDKGMQNLFS